jgi:glycosyltransferase involved in cell wall biosynthesis
LSPVVDILIPARDASRSIVDVVRGLPPRVARSVIVVDGGSTDATARLAEDAGALVLREREAGIGASCLRGLAHLAALPRPPDVVVFLAGDGADNPADVPSVLRPLEDNLFDLVIGSRKEGSLPLPTRAGRAVAVELIRAIYGHRYSDVGTFRAIRYPALVALGLREPGPGIFVEMQIKALRTGLRIAETPVRTGPVPRRGTISAAGQTLYQILRHATIR